MKNTKILMGLLLLGGILLTTSCKKEEEPEPVNEVEQRIVTKKWKHTKTISYGSFDVETDTIRASSDTTETIKENRHMDFLDGGDANYYDTQADTVSLEYRWTLSEDNSEIRIWEPASLIYPLFYSDFDYRIISLDDNKMVLKGDSKRRMIEAEYPTYGISQVEFTSF